MQKLISTDIKQKKKNVSTTSKVYVKDINKLLLKYPKDNHRTKLLTTGNPQNSHKPSQRTYHSSASTTIRELEPSSLFTAVRTFLAHSRDIPNPMYTHTQVSLTSRAPVYCYTRKCGKELRNIIQFTRRRKAAVLARAPPSPRILFSYTCVYIISIRSTRGFSRIMHIPRRRGIIRSMAENLRDAVRILHRYASHARAHACMGKSERRNFLGVCYMRYLEVWRP